MPFPDGKYAMDISHLNLHFIYDLGLIYYSSSSALHSRTYLTTGNCRLDSYSTDGQVRKFKFYWLCKSMVSSCAISAVEHFVVGAQEQFPLLSNTLDFADCLFARTSKYTVIILIDGLELHRQRFVDSNWWNNEGIKFCMDLREGRCCWGVALKLENKHKWSLYLLSDYVKEQDTIDGTHVRYFAWG